MANSNYVTKVAFVGAGGNSGSFMVEALLATGKHTVTAISRVGSQSSLPNGVFAKEVDYDVPETLVDALRGQDALVITLGGGAPAETQTKLINAAGEAGVAWILPNEWSPDTANESITKDVFPFQGKVAVRNLISELGKSSYIGVSTGFWYEWSLGIVAGFGIDIANRAVTFFDKGEVKISTSTWPQVGRAVAALLSLPVKPEGSDKKDCLQNFRDKVVYVKSFTISQKDMLQSVLRVTGTREEDWTIVSVPSHERYSTGLQEIQEGKRRGYSKMMYTRIFFPDGCGNMDDSKYLLNSLLDLPQEDLDEATKAAISASENPHWAQLRKAWSSAQERIKHQNK